MVLSGDGWTRGSVFECGRCHQGVQRSGGSCVLILAYFWLDLARIEDAEGRFHICVSQPGMKGPIDKWGRAIPHNKTSIGHLIIYSRQS